jgi:hypothetical protein
MNNTLANSYNKRITINSHPRSGTNFLRLNLANLLNLPLDMIGKHTVDHLSNNKNIFQVVVLRNPKDTIFSAYSHGERYRPQPYPTLESINFQIENYLFYLKCYSNFKDNINFYDFNDLEYALQDIALNFIKNMPENFLSKMPQETEKFTPSIKNSNFYNKLLQMNLKEEIFEKANLEYYKMLELCKVSKSVQSRTIL